jgi:hypothetical protein
MLRASMLAVSVGYVYGMERRFREAESGSMRCDDNGVGGFVEDLPVLVLILAGVCVLLCAGSWSAEIRARSLADEDLGRLAERAVDEVVWALSDGAGGCVDVDSVAKANLSRVKSLVPDGIAWLLTVEVVHPWSEPLLLVESGDERNASNTRSDIRLLNAPYGSGGCAVLKVVVVVWSPT